MEENQTPLRDPSLPPLTHCITWVNKENGRSGKGHTPFTQDEAEKLASEMNADYPNFIHTATPL